MLTIASSNLLAEKAYQKYGRLSCIPFAVRSTTFILRIQAYQPDILLLQEADAFWMKIIHDHIIPMGYAFCEGCTWSSAVVILYKKRRFTQHGSDLVHHFAAGILAIYLCDTTTNKGIQVVNTHAPWGKAEKYREVYQALLKTDGPAIFAGDLNTDSPTKNGNARFFLEEVFTTENGIVEITADLPFTARNVHTNNESKIDYMFTRGITARQICMVPAKVVHMLPHSPGGVFDASDPGNHYSDHCLLIVDLVL